MKFYGMPLMAVYEHDKDTRGRIRFGKRKTYLFTFDERGEYETDDDELSEKLKRKFRYDESENSAETGDEIKVRHCKKCEFTCTNQGDLLTHYRECHPKN